MSRLGGRLHSQVMVMRTLAVNIAALVKALPPATVIYSNAPEAVYYVSGDGSHGKSRHS
jgi:hypothetical protein